MTTTSDPQPAGAPVDTDDLFVGRGLLLADRSAPDGRHLPSVVISSVDAGAGLDGPSPSGLLLAPPSDADADAGSAATSLADVLTDELPVLDAWIVDLSLRHDRVTLVTPTDVLCSAPLVSAPQGWMSEVAAQGVLAVVVLCGPVGPTVGRTPVPARATRDGASVAARIPVCLSD